MIKNGLWFLLVLIALNATSVLGFWPSIVISFVIQIGLAAFILFAVAMAGVHCILLRCWR